MKSFAIVAAFAGAASAQAALGSCAQLCVNNMARIANQEFSCGAGDVACFCTKSNWAYGVRDCSRQACSSEESAQAVAWAAGQCGGVAQSASSIPAAVPILTSALASATGAAGSAIASLTSGAGAAVTTIPLVGTMTNSAGSVVVTTTGFSTVFGSLAGSAASRASGAASSAASAVSGVLSSGASAASSAASATNSAASSAASSASGALNSAASSLRSAASSAAASATAPPNAAVPLQTGLPVLAGAGFVAMLLL
ncbi:hypothetical protein GQ44DRAFT_440741 [Phaeosphaeriaceae sp. PMI808]|nr:hypothetical protein GQ44DRAFT_440741 [Phaeosphaeriaceae sp. PMI808]